VHPIHTLEDLIHAVTNSLSIISSHSQYLLEKSEEAGQEAKELRVIYESSGRAAKLLGQIPKSLAETPIQAHRNPESDDPPVTILVVDDEPQICEFLEKILREEGYEVVTAAGGAQALEVAARRWPQLILLDVVMPEMDGVSTLRELRRLGHTCAVIMLTAQGTIQTAREAMMLGAYDYIAKPFDLAFLRTVVQESLKAQRLNRRGVPACVL
jgi:CheY-like chemotaxis protein